MKTEWKEEDDFLGLLVCFELKAGRIQIRAGDVVAVIEYCKCMIWHLSGLTRTAHCMWK
jgi:hypothetical protein